MTAKSWATSTLGALGKWVGGGTPAKATPEYWTGSIPWVSPKDMRHHDLLDTEDHVSESAISESATSLVPVDSVLLVMRSGILKHTLPVAVARRPVAINQDLKALLPSGTVHAAFAAQLLRWLGPEILRRCAKVGTTVESIDFRSLKEVAIAVPPLPEQRKISAILSSVDEVIGRTEAVIEQLQAVKKAMMQEMLTRGLPGRHTRFKQTEIGEIPEEWEVRTLGTLAEFVTSGSRGWAQHYATDGALFIRSQNVRSGVLEFTECAFVDPPAGAEGERTKVRGNDLLITITGNSVGNVAHVPTDWRNDAFVSQHVGLVRLSDPSLAAFASMYLSPGAPGNEQVLAAQYGQSKPGLNLKNLRSFLLPLPLPSERMEIEAAITSVQQRIAAETVALQAVNAAKSALMSVLLTGELRVISDEAAA